MINVLGAGPACRSIDGPVLIEREKVGQLALIGAPFRFPPIDPFAGVLDHLSSSRDKLRRVHSPAMNFRAAKLYAEAGVTEIDARGAFPRAQSVRALRRRHARQIS